jgi:hypothetical protein
MSKSLISRAMSQLAKRRYKKAGAAAWSDFSAKGGHATARKMTIEEKHARAMAGVEARRAKGARSPAATKERL